MGRGRAKAKQTKVARQLKYGVPQTDLERLQAELHGWSPDDQTDDHAEESDDEDAEDPYAAYVDEQDDEETDA